MAITHVAVGTLGEGNNAAVTPGLPTGHQADDVLLCWAFIRDLAATLSIDQSYTTLLGPLRHDSGDVTAYLFRKVDGGSESAPTVTPSGGGANDTVLARVLGYRGMASDLDVTGTLFSAGSGANIGAIAGITPDVADSLVLVMAGRANDSNFDQLTDFTERVDDPSTMGNDGGIHVQEWIQSGGPTATGDRTLVRTSGTQTGPSIGILVAFAPAGGATQVTANLLDVSPSIEQASLRHRIFPGLLDQAPTLHQASLRTSIAANLLDVAPTIHAASLKHQITPALLDVTPDLFTATLDTGADLIAASLLDVAPTIHAASLQQRLTAALLDISPTLHTASLVHRLAAGLLNVTPDLFAASLREAISAALVDAPPTIHQAALRIRILAALADVSPELFQALISTPGVSVPGGDFDTRGVTGDLASRASSSELTTAARGAE